MWEYISNLCTSFTPSFFPWSTTKKQDFFIALQYRCWHPLTAAQLSLRRFCSAFPFPLPLPLPLRLFSCYTCSKNYCLCIFTPCCVCVTALFFHASWHFLPEFFPQKWQLTLAFNRTDLLLVRSRVVPSRILYPLLRLRSICLYVRLKPSCNCRLYYQQTTTWGVVIAVSSCSGCFTKQSNAAPLVAPSTLCGFAKIVVKNWIPLR